MRWVAPQEELEHHLVVAEGHPLVWRGRHPIPKKWQRMVALKVGKSSKTDAPSH